MPPLEKREKLKVAHYHKFAVPYPGLYSGVAGALGLPSGAGCEFGACGVEIDNYGPGVAFSAGPAIEPLLGQLELMTLLASSSGAPNKNPPQPTWRESFRQTMHFLCGKSPGDKVASSVAEGLTIGMVEGGVEGFIAGEVFGGEVTFGTSGFVGAYLGAHVVGAIGAANGLSTGAAISGVCYAGGMYD